MKKTYKTMSIRDTVARLRAGDYVDENRTAEIIVSLVSALDSARVLANTIMRENETDNMSTDVKNALLFFALKTADLTNKRI